MPPHLVSPVCKQGAGDLEKRREETVLYREIGTDFLWIKLAGLPVAQWDFVPVSEMPQNVVVGHYGVP